MTVRIQLEFNDKNSIIEDGKDLSDCITLEAKTVVAGGAIGIFSALILLTGKIVESKYIVFIGYTGLIFSLGVLSAFDLGRKLGNRISPEGP